MNTTMSLENLKHFPVMLERILSIVTPQHGGTFIDCTFGAGGYSKAILSFSNTEVVALDRDIFANFQANNLLKNYKKRFKFYNKKFSQINTIKEISKPIKAIILDLGYSMLQMKDLSRGFSFNSKGSLDMRMGLNSISAKEIVNQLDEQRLLSILKYFGEEKNYKKIVFQIISLRKKKTIDTKDLVELINKVKIKKYSRINAATKSFQALRIVVNNEISELIYGLIEATKKLKPGGMLLVITFHSIEDKIVKYFFKTYSEISKSYSRYIPELKVEDKRLFNYPKKKFIKASEKELLLNASSRSAKLRYVLRNNNKFIFPEEFIKKFKFYLDLEKIYL